MFRKYVKREPRLEDLLQTMPAPTFRGTPRVCLADGKPATFHRWVDEDRGLLRINAFTREEERERMYRSFRDAGIVPSCCSVEVLRATSALVEYTDGSVGKVKPELIQFLDRREG